jgi:hypothetical protein
MCPLLTRIQNVKTEGILPGCGLFQVCCVEMDWVMSSDTTEQERDSATPEYSAAHSNSSLKVGVQCV